MSKIPPTFPPVAQEWLPGEPFKEPPLPRFLWNPRAPPWLNPEDRIRIIREAGFYAARRAEAMVPASAGPQAAMDFAKGTWTRMLAGLMPGPTLAPARVGLKKRGRPRKPTPPTPTATTPTGQLVVTSRGPVLAVLPIEVKQQLIQSVKEFHRENIPNMPYPTPEDVQEWAEELEQPLTPEQAKAIIDVAK